MEQVQRGNFSHGNSWELRFSPALQGFTVSLYSDLGLRIAQEAGDTKQDAIIAAVLKAAKERP